MNQSPAKPARPFMVWLANRSTTGIVAAWIVTLLGFAGPLHWFSDTMNHPRWHLAWLCGLAAFVCWRAGKRRWMLASIACIVVLLACVQPWTWYLPSSRSTAQGLLASNNDHSQNNVRVLFWNINTDTRNLPEVIGRIDQESPDVVSLLELNPLHLPGLADLRTSHPFHKELPRSDSFGLGVYSKHPVDWIDVASDPPIIRGKVQVVGSLIETTDGPVIVDLWAVHTLPPMGSAYLASRNEQLLRLADQISSSESAASHTIVGGDFNITPWCQEFQSFVQQSGLTDSRRGKGYQATWPAKLGIFGIPIDHVLVDSEMQVLSRRVLPGASVSDHSAVLIDLRSAD